MKLPPFMLLAALLFWGWQSQLLLVGALLGVILESARWVKLRFDVAEEDFRRICSLCTLVTLAVAVIIFSTNDEGGGWNGLINGPTVSNASKASVHTATTLLCWMPMTMFLFLAAQKFSTAGVIPLSAISIIFRRRTNRDSQAVRPVTRKLNPA